MTMLDQVMPPQENATREKSVAAVQSVDRALTVLEIIGKAGTAGVSEIAVELGVHKSTVSRLIAVLEARGFVEQLSERGKYQLGFSIVRLAGSTTARLDLAKLSQGVCDGLAQMSGETTNVAILDGPRVINVVEAIGPAEVALRTWVGQTCPAHATSSGKALLSGLSPDAVHDLIGPDLEGFTAHTIADLDSLDAELERVRATGWASVREELEIGLNAVAAPVRDADGSVVAALSVSGPAYRLDPVAFIDIADATTAAAEEISARLGYRG
jgi:DNA-binding IclR family transcriptional regulator